MKISIISPVYNKIEKVKFCFEKNLEHASGKHEWIIIDNNSSKPTKEGLSEIKKNAEKAGHTFLIIREPYNTGVAAAWNKGLQYVSGDYICILNNDAFMMPDWDYLLPEAIKRYNLDIISPLIVEPQNFKSHYDEQDFLGEKRGWKKILSINKGRVRKGLFGGVIIFGEKKHFDSIGNFDERFWLSLEEMDYLIRALKKGLKTGMVGDVIAYHFVGLTRHTMHTDKGYANQRFFERKWGWHFEKNENRFINKMIRKYKRFLWKHFMKMAQKGIKFPNPLPDKKYKNL